jgi:hypothetical protein
VATMPALTSAHGPYLLDMIFRLPSGLLSCRPEQYLAFFNSTRGAPRPAVLPSFVSVSVAGIVNLMS